MKAKPLVGNPAGGFAVCASPKTVRNKKALLRRRTTAAGTGGRHSAEGVHNRVTISALTSARMGRGHTMRIFGYLGIGFLIVWLLVPTSMAMAETATIEAVTPDGMQSPSQPPEMDLLNLLD
jgi:hypothetical protein